MGHAERTAARRRRGIVTSVDEQLAVSRVRGKLFGGRDLRPRVGRYEVVKRLGQGSMGTVYLARDPDLDRYVALKLYRPRGNNPEPRADERLWREAQLLARVSHPNVVAVHEVGRLGPRDDTVFVAMEHVHGVNLSTWLEKHPTAGWRRVVELIEAAAAGLAAVHAAGILHRDLKPSNILVAADDGVRVLDFGLARLVDGRDLDPTPMPSPNPADTLVSGEGVVGTPAYMAPEQHESAPSSVSTDLYALCIAMFEALFGHRPFEGKTVHGLWKQKVDAEIDWTPQRGNVPRALRGVLRRSLDPHPKARFHSAEELVRALARVRRQSALWWAAGATVAFTLGAFTVFGGRYAEAACTKQGDALATAWNVGAATALVQAFENSGATFAANEAIRVRIALDGYARELIRAGHRACTNDSGNDPTVSESRWACLEARSSELASLVETFQRADGGVVAGARDAVGELTPAESCLRPNAAHLAAWSALQPTQRIRYREFLPALARAEALHHAGKHAAALAAATEVLGQSQDLASSDVPARAHYLRARSLRWMGRYQESEEAAESAILQAERASDPALAARAWSTLISTVGADAHRFEEALSHEVAARAALSRVEHVSAADVALLESALASTQAVQGDYVAAADRFERVLQHEPDLTPRRRMMIRYDLARMYNEIGQCTAGLEHGLHAYGLAQSMHGEHHPTTARMLFPVVGALRGLDRSTDAIHHARKAVSVLASAAGQTPTVDLVLGRLQLALALVDQGNSDAAVAALRRADTDAAALGLSSMVDGSVLLLRGRAACDLGQHADAIRLLEQSLGVLRASPKTPAIDQLRTTLQLARCQRERGDLERASSWVEAAQSIQFPGETPTRARVAMLEERARLELASDRVPDGVINVMATLARRVDRPSTAAVLEVLRAHAAATQHATDAARNHAESARKILVGADSRRARLLQAEVDAYVRELGEDETGETGQADG